MVILQIPLPHLQTGTHWNRPSRMLQSNPLPGTGTPSTKPGCSHGHGSSMAFLWCSCLDPVKEPQHHPGETLILPRGKGPLENQSKQSFHTQTQSLTEPDGRSAMAEKKAEFILANLQHTSAEVQQDGSGHSGCALLKAHRTVSRKFHF